MRILTFLNMLDARGNLSITNLLVIAMAIKVLTLKEIDLAAFATFFVAITNYRFKSYQANKIKG